MKPLITLYALFLLLIASSSYAGGHESNMEGRKHHGGGHKYFFSKLQSELELTPEQVEEIHALRSEIPNHNPENRHNRRKHRKQHHLMMSLNPESPTYTEDLERLAEERATKTREHIMKRGEMHAKLYAILTVEQKEKLNAIRMEHKTKMQQRKNE